MQIERETCRDAYRKTRTDARIDTGWQTNIHTHADVNKQNEVGRRTDL